MPAQKPREGDGPMEAIPAPKGEYLVKIPSEGGGRIVFRFNKSEIHELYESLAKLIGEGH